MIRLNRPNRGKTLRKAQSVRRVRKVQGLSDNRAGQHASLASDTSIFFYRQFGAVVQSQGDVQFRVWAPGQQQVLLEFPDQDLHMMHAIDSGFHEAVIACEPGARYRYRFLDGRTLPDPASRYQEGDVHGFSVVVDPAFYSWSHPDWRGLPWHQTVLYEIHAGLAGGFDGVRKKLPELKSLGITAIELMPVAAFPGERNWGYDGVLPYAPDESYGTPDQLRQLVDAAHGLGMQVFLDVVYNHFGPQGNYLYDCVPEFFRHDVHTPWGHAIDFRQPAVRAFFTENALYWLREYCFDGLRLDAVHAISEPDWLFEVAAAVRQEFKGVRHVHLIAENEYNDTRLLTHGFKAQWNDDAHHVMHHLLTGETQGFYKAYVDSPTDKLCRVLSEGFVYPGELPVAADLNQNFALRGESPPLVPSRMLPPHAFIFFLQNHDQIGNRIWGDRLSALCADRPELLRAAVTLQLLTPHIPFIFMGEERGTRRPFMYFTDFSDPELVQAIRQGRRDEFRRFSGLAQNTDSALPDPNDVITWEQSDPYADPVDEPVYHHYAELLCIRHQYVSPYSEFARVEEAGVIGEYAVLVRWRLDNNALLSIYCNLSSSDYTLDADTVRVGEWFVYGSRDNADVAWHKRQLSAASTVMTLADQTQAQPPARLADSGGRND